MFFVRRSETVIERAAGRTLEHNVALQVGVHSAMLLELEAEEAHSRQGEQEHERNDGNDANEFFDRCVESARNNQRRLQMFTAERPGNVRWADALEAACGHGKGTT